MTCRWVLMCERRGWDRSWAGRAAEQGSQGHQKDSKRRRIMHDVLVGVGVQGERPE